MPSSYAVAGKCSTTSSARSCGASETIVTTVSSDCQTACHGCSDSTWTVRPPIVALLRRAERGDVEPAPAAR